MAQSIDKYNKICIKQGDPIAFTVVTEGDVKASIDDTAKFMIKKNPDSDDSEAIISKDITVIIGNEIGVYVPSSETENLIRGKYYWSVKHYKGADEYTIIPDDGCEYYPIFLIGGALIHE